MIISPHRSSMTDYNQDGGDIFVVITTSNIAFVIPKDLKDAWNSQGTGKHQEIDVPDADLKEIDPNSHFLKEITSIVDMGRPNKILFVTAFSGFKTEFDPATLEEQNPPRLPVGIVDQPEQPPTKPPARPVASAVAPIFKPAAEVIDPFEQALKNFKLHDGLKTLGNVVELAGCDQDRIGRVSSELTRILSILYKSGCTSILKPALKQLAEISKGSEPVRPIVKTSLAYLAKMPIIYQDTRLALINHLQSQNLKLEVAGLDTIRKFDTN